MKWCLVGRLLVTALVCCAGCGETSQPADPAAVRAAEPRTSAREPHPFSSGQSAATISAISTPRDMVPRSMTTFCEENEFFMLEDRLLLGLLDNSDSAAATLLEDELDAWIRSADVVLVPDNHLDASIRRSMFAYLDWLLDASEEERIDLFLEGLPISEQQELDSIHAKGSKEGLLRKLRWYAARSLGRDSPVLHRLSRHAPRLRLVAGGSLPMSYDLGSGARSEALAGWHDTLASRAIAIAAQRPAEAQLWIFSGAEHFIGRAAAPMETLLDHSGTRLLLLGGTAFNLAVFRVAEDPLQHRFTRLSPAAVHVYCDRCVPDWGHVLEQRDLLDPYWFGGAAELDEGEASAMAWHELAVLWRSRAPSARLRLLPLVLEHLKTPGLDGEVFRLLTGNFSIGRGALFDAQRAALDILLAAEMTPGWRLTLESEGNLFLHTHEQADRVRAKARACLDAGDTQSATLLALLLLENLWLSSDDMAILLATLEFLPSVTRGTLRLQGVCRLLRRLGARASPLVERVREAAVDWSPPHGPCALKLLR